MKAEPRDGGRQIFLGSYVQRVHTDKTSSAAIDVAYQQQGERLLTGRVRIIHEAYRQPRCTQPTLCRKLPTHPDAGACSRTKPLKRLRSCSDGG